MNRCKALIRSFLARVGNRHKINDSALYQLYLQLVYPAHAQVKRAEERFYRKLVEGSNRNVIFDIGANVGSKTAVFRKIAKTVISVEPTPAVAAALSERFAQKRNVVIVPKGVGSHQGMARLYVFAQSSPYNTFSSVWADTLNPANRASGSGDSTANELIDVPLTTLDELIREHGVPSYIKIDVEGYEREVIKGLTVEIPALSFEANLPTFLKETLDCIAILSERWPTLAFNYVTKDPPAAFASSRWLTPVKMAALVADSQLRYMEIYCRRMGPA